MRGPRRGGILQEKSSPPPSSGAPGSLRSRSRRNGSGVILLEASMPLVDIQLIKGVFNDTQKKAMIEKVTEAMLGVEGESLRGVTWVRVLEVGSGDWAIGGKLLTAADVQALAQAR